MHFGAQAHHLVLKKVPGFKYNIILLVLNETLNTFQSNPRHHLMLSYKEGRKERTCSEVHPLHFDKFITMIFKHFNC